MNLVRPSERGLRLFTLVVTTLGAIAVLTTSACRSAKKGGFAAGVSNVRQIKLVLDAFATDYNGQFPNEDTAEEVFEGGLATTYSNDYFRQLFLAGSTDSEVMFWMGNSPLCNKKRPDDEIEKDGRIEPGMILQAGDCHWAYVKDQTNLNTGSKPLIVEGFHEGKWDGGALGQPSHHGPHRRGGSAHEA